MTKIVGVIALVLIGACLYSYLLMFGVGISSNSPVSVPKGEKGYTYFWECRASREVEWSWFMPLPDLVIVGRAEDSAGCDKQRE